MMINLEVITMKTAKIINSVINGIYKKKEILRIGKSKKMENLHI